MTNNRNRQQNLITNEMRSFNKRGFHDGYDEGKLSTSQNAFDEGYKESFEQNFILFTLKGVAQALKSSHNIKNNTNNTNNNNNNLNNNTNNHSNNNSNSNSNNNINSNNTNNHHKYHHHPHRVCISNNHLTLLESMKFDDASNIDNIKNNLVKICRENRLEILAHYVSQIG